MLPPTTTYQPVHPIHIDVTPTQPTDIQQPPPSSTNLWLAYFILGTLNNLTYVVILSSAQSIAQTFDALSYIGVIAWANVSFGMLIRIVNTLYWLHTSHHTRITLVSIMSATAMLGLAISLHISFPACILAIVVLGCCSSLGESVILGHMKHGQATLLGAWSSGTGAAGVLGTLLYLLMYSALRWSDTMIYLVLLPTTLVYFGAWRYIHNNTSQLPYVASTTDITAVTDESLDDDDNTFASVGGSATTPSKHAAYHDMPTPTANDKLNSLDDSAVPHRSNMQMLQYVLPTAMQLAAVYCFEYVVSVEFASRANTAPPDTRDWALLNAYEILAFCYQLGVLVARSSISYIRIRRVWMLTALQAVNFVIWWVHVQSPFMPLYVQFVAMIYVGLLGGFMYLSVFSLLIRDVKLSGEQRELAINYTQIAINMGIVASSVFDIVFDRYVLHK